MSQPPLSHLDPAGQARMVDVGGKGETERAAVARGRVIFSEATLAAVLAGDTKKGDVRAVARLAGIQAAKRTSDLIPLCHPISLTHVDVQVEPSASPSGMQVEATVQCVGRTGVEMEALTAVAVACLTVYDMIKGIDRAARITDVRLVAKRGGRSGDIRLE
jgi:cyclic pyranopterin monophosphate synthase